MMRRARLVPLVPLVTLALAGCGAGDRDMKEPTAAQRAVTTTTTLLPSPAPTADVPLQITSSAFLAGAEIPAQYTCFGANISPPIQWANLPAGVMELAIVVRDPQAEGFVHWVITGLSPVIGGLAEGKVPEDAIQALNQTGSLGWFGPCPPTGTGTHTYEFALYAFSTPPGVTSGQDARTAAQLVESQPAVAQALVNGTVAAP